MVSRELSERVEPPFDGLTLRQAQGDNGVMVSLACPAYSRGVEPYLVHANGLK